MWGSQSDLCSRAAAISGTSFAACATSYRLVAFSSSPPTSSTGEGHVAGRSRMRALRRTVVTAEKESTFSLGKQPTSAPS